MPLTWKPEYSVGNPAMDAQHRKLLTLCGTLEEMAAGNTHDFSEMFHDVLNELSEYANRHFKEEEALLRKISYPEQHQHALEHGSFYSALTDILYDAGLGNLDLKRLSDLASQWLMFHILESDMKYKPYVLSHVDATDRAGPDAVTR